MYLLHFSLVCLMSGKCGLKGKGLGVLGDECEHKTDCMEKLRCIDAKCDQVSIQSKTRGIL